MIVALGFLFSTSGPISQRDSFASSDLLSPRLAVLVQQLEQLDAGNRNALNAFWREIEAEGTPLIEPIENDPDHVLVTFLWRAKEETKNVVVVGGVVPWGYRRESAKDQLMNQLLDTDLWYKTYRIGADARCTYVLSPNDPLTEGVNLGSAYRYDPFNPRQYVFTKDSENPQSSAQTVSVMELPKAPPQPWLKPRSAVAAGPVELTRFESKILGNERRLWIYTPAGYKTSGRRYGILILFDGYEYVRWIPTPIILDNLIHEGRIPPLIAVMVDTVPWRGELACYPPFVDFLADELLPWIRSRYHVTSNRRSIIVGGSSLGGLAAAYCGLRRPDIFGNILSQSGSFWWWPKLFWPMGNGRAGEADVSEEPEWLTRQYVKERRLPLRFYLDVGLLERLPTHDGGPSQLTVNRHLRDVLQAKGYPVHYVEFNGRHEYLSWQGTLAEGLIALVGNRPRSENSAERRH